MILKLFSNIRRFVLDESEDGKIVGDASAIHIETRGARLRRGAGDGRKNVLRQQPQNACGQNGKKKHVPLRETGSGGIDTEKRQPEQARISEDPPIVGYAAIHGIFERRDDGKRQKVSAALKNQGNLKFQGQTIDHILVNSREAGHDGDHQEISAE
jgi:hypothetical protein